MAVSKVKGTSKKIKELKGIKPEKVTEKQLKKIQNLVDKLNRSKIQVGRIEVEKHEIMHLIAGVNDELQLMQEELVKEYGTFDVDIQNGNINYPKENGQTDS